MSRMQIVGLLQFASPYDLETVAKRTLTTGRRRWHPERRGVVGWAQGGGVKRERAASLGGGGIMGEVAASDGDGDGDGGEWRRVR